MSSSGQLTQEYLKSRLTYDPDTGAFLWRHLEGKDPVTCMWNKKFSGVRVGSADKNGYWSVNFKFGRLFLHRLAFLYMTGAMPPECIDHINGDRSDNRFSNLRAASVSENSRNRRKPKNNKSGHIGVCWIEPAKRWCAQITVDRKVVHLGQFKNLEDAIAARAIAQRDYGFHENHGKAPGAR